MNTNELLIEFIKFSNKLEPERNQIPISRANIFLAQERPEFKKLDLHIVSNNEVAVCGYCKGEGWIEEPMRTVPCPRCGGNKQTDC